MKDIAALLEEPNVTVAVVGATDNPVKYGFVIYRDLKRKGYRVLPVNPKRIKVDGDLAYPSLTDLPYLPNIVNIVVPPVIASRVIREAKKLCLMNIWLQPGAENVDNLRYLHENGFNYLSNACIMIQSRRSDLSG